MATREEQPKIEAVPGGSALEGTSALGLKVSDTVAVVQARGYWEQVWRRFKRDRAALAGAAFVIVLVFVAFAGAPIAAHFLGHGPNDQFAGGADANGKPVGPWSWVSTAPYTGASGHWPKTLLILGGDSSLGRDEFLRLLYGAQVSIEVALGATLISMFFGVTFGAMAGYFRGWSDTVVSRFLEITMAFPIFLFIIALASTVGDQLNDVTFGGVLGKGVFTLVLVIGIFGWYYPARIVRGQVLSLREKEFVEAARMTGASDWRIIRSHLMPHLVAIVIVYSTLIIAATVLLEAGLSYLGVGIPLPTASWGNMLSSSTDWYLTVPWLMLWPGMAILCTVLAFNLMGDGMRDAFDPRSSR